MYGYKLVDIRNIQDNLTDAKVSRFVRTEDRLRATGSILLQKEYIRSHYPELDYRDIVIQRTEYGKPFYRDLVYNVSHDSDLVIIAYSESGSIGVDIMKLCDVDITPYLDCFSDREKATLTNANFFSYWCAKEAFVKALGVGLSINLSSVEFIDGAIWYDGNVYPVDRIDIDDMYYCCVLVLCK